MIFSKYSQIDEQISIMSLGYFIFDLSFLQLSFNLLKSLTTFHTNFDSWLLNDFNCVLFHIYRLYGL